MFPGAEVELGQEIEFPKPTDVLGRIAAQTAKQVIFQKVREAERDNVFAEYSGRVGEVVNGIVKRQEMGDFVVDLGRAEAAPAPQGAEPRRGLPDRRPRAGGDRARGEGGQGPAGRRQPHRPRPADQALRDGGARDLRRHRPDQGRACARRASAPRWPSSRASGTSTPSAPASGMKGTRVQSIIRELRGEKIDIVEWSEDPVDVRRERPLPGQDQPRLDRRRRAEDHGGRRRGQAALASPSARRARTCASPPSSSAGASTSRARRRSATRSRPRWRAWPAPSTRSAASSATASATRPSRSSSTRASAASRTCSR